MSDSVLARPEDRETVRVLVANARDIIQRFAADPTQDFTVLDLLTAGAFFLVTSLADTRLDSTDPVDSLHVGVVRSVVQLVKQVHRAKTGGSRIP